MGRGTLPKLTQNNTAYRKWTDAVTVGNRALCIGKLGQAGVYLTLKRKKSDIGLRSKGHLCVLGCFPLVCFWFYLFDFVLREKSGKEHSRQKEHKNILSEVSGAVLNLFFPEAQRHLRHSGLIGVNVRHVSE